MTIFLSVIGFLFREGLVQAKYLVNPASRNAASAVQQSEDQAKNDALKSTLEQFGLSGTTLSGAENTFSGAKVEVTTNSGATTVSNEGSGVIITTSTGA